LFCTLIAKVWNGPSCHPIFSTCGNDPQIYLEPSDIDLKRLNWPEKPHRASLDEGLPSVKSEWSAAAKCDQDLIHQFHVVEFKLGELEFVKESQKWTDLDLTKFSNSMMMLIPKKLNVPDGA
jgi:hypothetical protein